MQRVVVVGGGLSGLEFAVALQRCDRYEVVVLEWGDSLRKEHEQRDSRHYDGDQRIRTWRRVGEDWGDGTGLKRRLGGRSLCWHGVVLPIEDYALAKWPTIWQRRLWDDGLYARTFERLYAASSSISPLRHNTLRDLTAVPRATSPFTMKGNRLPVYERIYSPLHELDTSRVRVVKGARVNRAFRRGSSLFVVFTVGGEKQTMKADLCVLAAGSVENARIVCDSLGEPFEGTITDHLCVGAVSRCAENASGGEQEWALKYSQRPDLRCNIFVQEHLPVRPGSGERVVDVWALAEQDPVAGSPLSISPAPSPSEFGSVTIGTHIALSDWSRLHDISRELDVLLDTYADVLPEGRYQSPPRYQAEPIAMSSVMTGSADRVHYRIPLGAVDHEASTLPMGQMVSTELGLDGMEGIHVLGASVFPSSGAANPSLTALSLSNWLARHLIYES